MTRDASEVPEFACCECGRHIMVLCGCLPPSRLCAACQTIPGWYRDPRIRAVLDPEHDGREIWERQPGLGAGSLP